MTATTLARHAVGTLPPTAIASPLANAVVKASSVMPGPIRANAAPAPVHALAQELDRDIRASIGRATGSLSVASALLAHVDWAVNLLVSPGKQAELNLLAFEYAC